MKWACAEFAGPDDQRFVQQATGREIGKQGGDWLIDFAGLAERAFVGVVVVVPIFRIAAAGDDLHEPHATLHQPPGDQAARAEIARDFIIQTIHLVRFDRFLADINRLGRRRLHPKSEFVTGDA